MKKLIAIILSITLLFSFTALPASAELGQPDTSININEAKSIFERIGDIFHNLIANIFKMFGQDCPLCENHDGFGEAGGDGDYNKAEIAKQYNDAINNLKAYNKTLKIEHTSNIDLEITDCSSQTFASIIDDVLENIEGRDESTKNFKNGESSKINAFVPPTEKDAALNGAYLERISMYKINDNTKIEFGLMDSESRFDGTTVTNPVGYSDVLDPLNIGALDLGPISITEADISYKDVTVELVLDHYGRVKSFKSVTKIAVDAIAKVSKISMSVNIEGSIVEEYEVKY